MEKVAEYLPSLFSVEKQLVERATVDDDNPTPGYLLDEIGMIFLLFFRLIFIFLKKHLKLLFLQLLVCEF